MAERWEGDERGRGVASAALEIFALDGLRDAMSEPDWVAEEPEAHLLPHLEGLCEERGWRLERADVVDHVLDAEVVAPAESRRELRAVAFALVGSFAELSTHVVEQRTDERAALAVVVTTGMVAGGSDFAPHGHVVRLRVRAA